jgi:ArsR family transcriptional regulator
MAVRTTAAHKELSILCKALAHPMRVQILRTLLERHCLCGDLVETLPLAQSTVSEHLRILKAAGLIEDEVEGPRRRYCVNRKRLAQLKEWVSAL